MTDQLQEGDTLELSLWYNDQHPQEFESAQVGIYRAFHETELKLGVKMGPVNFTVLAPGDPRVPEPPKEFQGTPRIMIGEAVVEKLVPVMLTDDIGFTQDLEDKDLETLRAITRRTHRLYHPFEKELTDEQADAIINEVGPETAMKSLRSGKDERILS